MARTLGKNDPLRVYHWLRSRGRDGGTSADVAAALGVTRRNVHGRLGQLERHGYVTASRQIGRQGMPYCWRARPLIQVDLPASGDCRARGGGR